MTQILLMAAGAGTRFPNSPVPKPFIDVGGTPMWMHCADKWGLGFASDHMRSLVIRKACQSYVDTDSFGGSECLVDSVDTIPDMTELGPAWSVIASTLTINPYEDVLLLDSDCYLETGRGLQSAVLRMLDARPSISTQAIIFGCRADETDHNVCTIKHAKRSEVVKVQEGGCDQFGLFGIGAYWFRSMSYFRYCLNKVDKTREAKISDVINACGTNTVQVEEMQGTFINLGSEALLAKYNHG